MTGDVAVLVEATDERRDGTAYFWEFPGEPVAVRVIRPQEVRSEAFANAKSMGAEWVKVVREVDRLMQLREAIEGKTGKPRHRMKDLIERMKKIHDADVEVLRIVSEEYQLTKEYQWPGRPPIKSLVFERPEALSQSERVSIEKKSTPRSLFAERFTRAMTGARWCVYVDNRERLRFGLYCSEPTTAFRVCLLLADQLVACLDCGRLFSRRRNDKQFHTEKCKDRYRKRMDRLEAKEKRGQ